MSNVIACIDGTPVSEAVCDYASWASLRLQAPLELLHVLEKSEYPVQTNLSGNIGLGSREALLDELAELDQKRGKLAMQQGKLILEAAQQRVTSSGVDYPGTRQRHGNLVETLLEMESSTRLLVMGKHDEHLNVHVGSRLETVVRSLHRPILITTHAFQEPKRLMIAFDGSDTTCKVVDEVAGSPLFKGLPCHVVMVAADNSKNRGQMEWARHTLEAAEFEVITALIPGEVEQVLCGYRAQEHIDILVMGAYGHSVVRRFLIGSTTTNVIRNAQVPVLLMR